MRFELPVLMLNEPSALVPAVHDGFVGGIVDADLEVVEQLFTLARVEGVEVRGFLRARFRQDEGVDDLGTRRSR